MSVRDLAVESGGNILYVIKGDQKVYKSTNSGISWGPPIIHPPNTPPGFVFPPKCIAIAPDDPNVVGVSDSRVNGNQFWISTNGGLSWANLGVPKAGTYSEIKDIAISATTNTGTLHRYYFAAISDTRYHDTTLGDVRMRNSNIWDSMNNVAGTHDYMAVQVSANFVVDQCVTVIGAKATGGVDYQILTVFNTLPQLTVPLVLSSTLDYAYPSTGYSIRFADLSMPPTFDNTDPSSRLAFANLASNLGMITDGVFRITNNTPIRILPATPSVGIQTTSVDYQGSKLLVGGRTANRVFRCNNPKVPNPLQMTWITSVIQGQKEVEVGASANYCYAGTNGTNSALCRTSANGTSYSYIFACNPNEKRRQQQK
jgi:hypothetical protein